MHSGVLMLRSLDAPVPVKITPDVTSVLFSKDGTKIYFTREVRAGSGRKLWSVRASGGEPQPLEAADLGAHYLFDGLTMSPDGNAIIALAEAQDGRNYWLASSSPPGAEWRRLPSPAFNGPFPNAHLRFSPDGKQLLVAGGSKAWIVDWPAADRPPRQVLTSFRIGNGADWLPDSRHVLMHLAAAPEGRGGGLFIGDTQSDRIYAMELHDSGARQPTAGPGGKFLIPYDAGDTDIVEIPLDGSSIRPRIASTRVEKDPDWSRAGDQMDYITAQNGPAEIWIWSTATDLYRPLVTQLQLPAGVTGLADPAFSPDGRRVAFATAQGGIWMIPSTGGTAVPVIFAGERGGTGIDLRMNASATGNQLSTAGTAAMPTWSRDGEWLAYRANRNGKLYLEKVRIGDPDHPVTILPTTQGIRPSWSPDGRWITLATDQRVDLTSPDGKVTKHVHGQVTSWTSAGWSRDGKTLYLAITDGHKDPVTAEVWAILVDSGEEHLIGRYSQVFFGGSPSYGLSMSPDGKSLTATAVRPFIYIWLVEGIRPPESLWQRWLSRSSAKTSE